MPRKPPQASLDADTGALAKQRPIVAIIGGMGPESSAYFHQHLLHRFEELQKPKRDQDFPDIIHFSMASILPDRSNYLLDKTLDDPSQPVIAILKALDAIAQGYNRPIIAAVICNTFHSFPIWGKVIAHQKHWPRVKLINLVDYTVRALKFNNPWLRRIGILSSNGERQTQLYKTALEGMDITGIYIDTQLQPLLHNLIYHSEGLKVHHPPAPKIYQAIGALIAHLKQRNVQAVLMGCAELSFLEFTHAPALPVVDPLKILADHIIAQVVLDKS